jgi:Bacterial RNA polymerase, alpha chain C terminal domain
VRTTDSLSVALRGQTTVFQPHQAEAVVEVRGPKGSLVDRGVIGVNKPAADLKLGPPGPHEVRLTLPSGEVLTQGFVHGEGALSPVVFDLFAISPHEHLQRAALVQSIPETSTGDLRTPALVSSWVRLWERRDSRWSAVPPPLDARECHWYPDSVRYRLQLGHRQYALQVGGPGVPWVLICLPAAGSIDVVVRPLRGEASPPLELIAVSSNTAADALLGYLSRGAVPAAASLVEDQQELATLLLHQKVHDPYAAAVGGYYLLRIGEIERRMQRWPANLSDWMGWISDGPIIRGWQLLRGTSSHRRGETARGRFLEAIERGLPVYTEGLRLLIDGLKVVVRESRGKDHEAVAALESVGRYGAATDWSRPVLTFSGVDPDLPDTRSPSGFPESRDGLLFLYEVTLGDLSDHGLLRPGTSVQLAAPETVLTRQDRVTATITPAGTMHTGSWEYVTPADAIVPEFVLAADAWWSWTRTDGTSLGELRQRARCQPPASLQEELGRPVAELSLSTRVEHGLEQGGIGTIGDLTETTREGLLALPKIGAKAMAEIDDALGQRGLSLQAGHADVEPAPKTNRQ